VEKKKYELCGQILKRMKTAGILDKVVLIGSWCVIFYEDYFKGSSGLPAIRTRDLDILIPLPPGFDHKLDFYDLLKDLGFLLDYKGRKGYMVFQHPDLILEFLVPARGRDSDRPYPVPQLGINAQPLRFLDFLVNKPVKVLFQAIEIIIPHPANYSLHKLIIAGRRKNKDKAERDREQAVAILNLLKEDHESELIRNIYYKMPKKWQFVYDQTLRMAMKRISKQCE